MADKVAYVFVERGGYIWSWFAVHADGIGMFDSARETARTIRELRKKGYEIVDSDVPIGELMIPADAEKYRGINVKEKRSLAKLDAELEHWEKYPGMFPKELETLEDFRERGIKQGCIWVDDVKLYTPEMLKSAAKLTREMGKACYPPPQTAYRLHADGNPYISGRRSVLSFAEPLRVFRTVLSLRNASPEEANEFSPTGRPFTGEELKELIRGGVEIETG